MGYRTKGRWCPIRRRAVSLMQFNYLVNLIDGDNVGHIQIGLEGV